MGDKVNYEGGACGNQGLSLDRKLADDGAWTTTDAS